MLNYDYLQGLDGWLSILIVAGFVFIFMTVESSIIPFPSEIVMIPAGYIAYKGDFGYYFFLLIILGTLGSLLGAVINYHLGGRYGYRLLRKYGKYILVKHRDIAKVRLYFRKNGELATLIGRLVPIVRQYISFVAGVVRMNFKIFAVFTTIGSFLWVTILAVLGYLMAFGLTFF